MSIVFSELPLPVPGRPDVVEPVFPAPAPPVAAPFPFAAVAVAVVPACPAFLAAAAPAPPAPPPAAPSALVGDGCRLKTRWKTMRWNSIHCHLTL